MDQNAQEQDERRIAEDFRKAPNPCQDILSEMGIFRQHDPTGKIALFSWPRGLSRSMMNGMRMYKSFFEAARYVTPLNLSSTVTLFKQLGRSSQAIEILQHYVKSRSDQPEVFNLEHSPFGYDVKDPDVIEAFKKQYASYEKPKVQPADILLRIDEQNGWNPEDITTLSKVSVGDYRAMFKTNKGRNLRRLISACLQFDRIGNASAEMKEVSKRAKDALKIIAKESPINARRVTAYKVDIETVEDKNTS